MAAKAKSTASGHSPVSNQEKETAEVSKKAVFKAPSEGINPKTVKASSDGSEAVPGHKKAELMSAEVWNVPKDLNLRDIGEASFGPPPPIAETVHGPDNRTKITNTSSYPWRVHASLLITARDNSQWIGTGWFIGPHTLMTAGHVVFIKNSGVSGRDGWVKSIKVMPGRNGASLPYGSVTSTNFRSNTGWTNNGDENFDYGAIIIPTNLGNQTGWLGFGVYSNADLLASTGNISGYPGDKPSGTQWYDSKRIASVNSRKVYYDIDTAGGQSGSAVYRIVNGNRYAFGIHAYGGATTNSGTRIITAIYNNMVAWKA
ncbi:MAG TPA: endopeptidase [Ignavibacteria bacterium]|nr:endopeptidase [Ignavibacteria bacterium]